MKIINSQNQLRDHQEHITRQNSPKNKNIQLQSFSVRQSFKNTLHPTNKTTSSIDFKLRTIKRDLEARKYDEGSSVFNFVAKLQERGKLIPMDQNQKGLYITIIRTIFNSLYFCNEANGQLSNQVNSFTKIIRVCCIQYLGEEDAEYISFCLYVIKKLLPQQNFGAFWDKMPQFEERILDLFIKIVRSNPEHNFKRRVESVKQFSKNQAQILDQKTIASAITCLNTLFEKIASSKGPIISVSQNLLGSNYGSEKDFIFRFQLFGSAASYFVGEKKGAYAFTFEESQQKEAKKFYSFSEIIEPLPKQDSVTCNISELMNLLNDESGQNLEELSQKRAARLSNKNTRTTRQSSYLLANLEQIEGGAYTALSSAFMALEAPPAQKKCLNSLYNKQLLKSITISQVQEQNQNFASEQQYRTLPKPNYNIFQTVPEYNSFSLQNYSFCPQDQIIQGKFYHREQYKIAVHQSPQTSPMKNKQKFITPQKVRSEEIGNCTQRKNFKLPDFLKENNKKKRMNFLKVPSTDPKNNCQKNSSQKKLLGNKFSEKSLLSLGNFRSFRSATQTPLERSVPHSPRNAAVK